MKRQLLLLIALTVPVLAAPKVQIVAAPVHHTVRYDYYAKDTNQNGKIDDEEWTEVRTVGTLEQLRSNAPRPTEEDESHRWTIVDEESSAVYSTTSKTGKKQRSGQ